LLLLNYSHYKLTNDLKPPTRRINEIIHGKRSVTVDTDLRLSRALGTSEEYWIGLQKDYDLEEHKEKIKDELNCIGNLALKENKFQKIRDAL
jgi:antitoxin HigA-1